jgi:hypothetical protein
MGGSSGEWMRCGPPATALGRFDQYDNSQSRTANFLKDTSVAVRWLPCLDCLGVKPTDGSGFAKRRWLSRSLCLRIRNLGPMSPRKLMVQWKSG